MNTEIYLPESLYNLSTSMSIDRLKEAEREHFSVTGVVTQYVSQYKCLKVYLGSDIYGEMPIEDATIYNLYKTNGYLSPNITYLVGQKVRVKVTYVDETSETIRLSRKLNMLEALGTLLTEKFINNAVITSLSYTIAYLDIGAGILGRILPHEMSGCYFTDLNNDLDISVGSSVRVKILNYDPEIKRFELSKVQALPTLNEVVAPGDIVICKVLNPIKDQDLDFCIFGYFSTINGYLPSILDSPIELERGTKVVCTVKKISESGAHLSFNRIINL